MDEDLEERIERKKKYIADYIRLSKTLGVDETQRQKTIDYLLEDLSKLMKMRKD